MKEDKQATLPTLRHDLGENWKLMDRICPVSLLSTSDASFLYCLVRWEFALTLRMFTRLNVE